MLLTKSSTFLIGHPIADILGMLMNGIFNVLYALGIQNTGLSIIGMSIIVFTIVIYMALLPLTIKQQKFAKLQSRMSPELQAIQNKYRDKKDNDSMIMMNQETKAVYARYGVSPTGSCVQLLIQMPILFALYQVIYNMPAYVTKIRMIFVELVNELMGVSGSAEFLQTFSSAARYSKQFTNEAFTSGNTEYISNTYIDVLNRASSADWTSLAQKYPEMESLINQTHNALINLNSFGGLDIGEAPRDLLMNSWQAGAYGLAIGALLIPVLAALTQFINVKLMPQQNSGSNRDNKNDQAEQMAQQMKIMNNIMPLMSAMFCFTLPAGMGVYWISGSVVRSVQQVLINKHIDKMDIEAVIAANEEKAKKKIEKEGVKAEELKKYSSLSTKALYNGKGADNKDYRKNTDNSSDTSSSEQSETYVSDDPNSLFAKVNMVKEYNNRKK
ncbi:MAG: YidC/Oxa1 family membrane protein insertase [Lachnospiraceae bacterium]|nr:YidC/Oxa1 family membrane protein insertase [Lachnospiraceae bacterium]